MKITLEMLLHFMRDLNPIIWRKEKKEYKVIGVQLFCFPNDKDEYTEEKTEYCYVANLSELWEQRVYITGDMTILASQDIELSIEEMNQICGTIVLVYGSCQVPCLLNRMINIFRFFTNWDKTMHISALQGKSIQELLNLSEPVLEHPAIIFDAGFDVIAYTKNVSGKYVGFHNTVNSGYTDMKIMQQIKKMEIFSRLKIGEALVAPAAGEGSQRNVYMAFYNYQAIIGYACVFLDKENPNMGYLDMLRIFMENMTLCLKRDYKNQRFGQKTFETFLSNLINPSEISPEQVAEQVRNIDGLSEYSRFILGVFDFQDEVPLTYLARVMDNEMWDVKPFINENQLCLLRILGEEDTQLEMISAFEKNKISKIMGSNSYIFGISHEFRYIMDLKYAFRQAQVAIKFGKAERKNVCLYSDYCYYDLFEVMEEKMPVEKLKAELYKQLKEYDSKNKTRYCKLILTYLECDCNATCAAEKMYMHRNSIRKAVQHVEEKWQVSLADKEIKKKMLISEQIDNFLGTCSKI